MKTIAVVRMVVRLTLVAMLCLGLVATAGAFTISGTVTNNSGKSGRIFLTLFDQNWNSMGLGTSIPAAGAYTISGVPSGSYYVGAFVDALNTGVYIATDPNASVPVSVGGANVSGINLTFGVKSVPPVVPLSDLWVMPGDGMVLLGWDVPEDSGNGGYLAEKYDFYWSTTPNPGPANYTGRKLNVPFSSYREAFVTGLTNGQSLYFTIIPYFNGVIRTDAQVSSDAPVTIGPLAGGSTVSGTVTSAGIAKSPSAPLMVALVNEDANALYLKYIAPPISDNHAFTITGVQPGSYELVAFLDLDNNGVKLPPDVGSYNEREPYIVVSSGRNVSHANLNLATTNAAIELGTGYYASNYGSQYDSYSLNMQVDWLDAAKRVVGVRVSGPGLSEILDLGGRPDWDYEYYYNFNFTQGTRPAVGDVYNFAVSYSDGTAETIPVAIRSVLDKVGAYPSIPAGNITSTQPLIGWRWPGAWMEGAYGYNVNTWGQNGWWNGEVSMFQLYAPYNFNDEASSPTLTLGQQYEINVSIGDPFNSWSARSISVTPVAGGPVISGFSPQTGTPGTTVTITGSGFSSTPTNNYVSFNGYGTTVNSASATQLVVTVPTGVAAGPIMVTNSENATTAISSSPFTAMVTVSGKLTDNGGVGVSGAAYYLEGVSPAVSGTTDVNGNYAVPVPAGAPFMLRFSKANYLDAHSHIFTANGNVTSDYTLFTTANLPAISTGKGILRSRVVDHTSILNNAGLTAPNLAGATVAATSLVHPDTAYAVTYNGGGTSTDSTGIYYVNNVDEGDVVVVKAFKAGYDFYPRTFATHAGAVGEGRLRGSQLPSTLVSPSSGSYSTPLTLTFTANQPGTILYSLDGSDPARSGYVCGSNYSSYSWTCNVELVNPGATTVKYFNRNAFGISEEVKTISYTLSVPDIESPTVYNFFVSSPVAGLTVPVNFFNAFDNVGVTGYLITLSPTPPSAGDGGWSGDEPTAFNLPQGTANGAYTLYAWAKDAAGNVSLPMTAVVTVDIEYLLDVTVNGTGSGTVTSMPEGISCTAGTCSSPFDQNTQVDLTATSSADSTFVGWAGAGCTGTADCTVAMSEGRSVTATFDLKPARIKEIGTATAYYYYLDEALTACGTGTILRLQQAVFTENATLASGAAVTLEGGYDSTYAIRSGYSTLSGILTIGNGSMIVDMLTVK